MRKKFITMAIAGTIVVGGVLGLEGCGAKPGETNAKSKIEKSDEQLKEEKYTLKTPMYMDDISYKDGRLSIKTVVYRNKRNGKEEDKFSINGKEYAYKKDLNAKGTATILEILIDKNGDCEVVKEEPFTTEYKFNKYSNGLEYRFNGTSKLENIFKGLKAISNKSIGFVKGSTRYLVGFVQFDSGEKSATYIEDLKTEKIYKTDAVDVGPDFSKENINYIFQDGDKLLGANQKGDIVPIKLDDTESIELSGESVKKINLEEDKKVNVENLKGSNILGIQDEKVYFAYAKEDDQHFAELFYYDLKEKKKSENILNEKYYLDHVFNKGLIVLVNKENNDVNHIAKINGEKIEILNEFKVDKKLQNIYYINDNNVMIVGKDKAHKVANVQIYMIK